jgi:hypothetical protein
MFLARIAVWLAAMYGIRAKVIRSFAGFVFMLKVCCSLPIAAGF